MKYVKMLGLLAMAAAAVMAFVGSASAATLTSPTGTVLGTGTVIKAAAEGVTKLDGSVDVACNESHVEGTVTNAGGGVPTQTVEGNITKLEFTGCAKDTVNVLAGGSLSIHSLGNGNGTLTSTGAIVTVQLHRTLLGFPITTHCIYVTNNTHIGTVTGSHNTASGTATLDIDSALIPQEPTDGACGENAEWTGSYEVTEPDPLYID